jgi:hypothetical protein
MCVFPGNAPKLGGCLLRAKPERSRQSVPSQFFSDADIASSNYPVFNGTAAL